MHIERLAPPLALLLWLMPATICAGAQPPAPVAASIGSNQPILDSTGPGSAEGTPPGYDPGTASADAMADIHDIKPIIAPNAFPWKAVWLTGSALLLLVLLMLGRHLLQKRRGAEEIPTLTPELSPEENARLALNALEGDRLADGRRFYFRLSEILRRYLLERYAIGAPEMTPEELRPLVAHLDLPTGQLNLLDQFWSRSEPIKFAGRPAQEAHMAEDLAHVRHFVTVTTDALAAPAHRERAV
ncbi:MAG: DUF4381 family protein [Desulfosarcinaceae bacterium]|nr:DUF4381 family protein [Desulfosarcinaceae bacterium]